MRKLVKCYWPLLLGMIVCVIMIQIQKCSKLLLDPTVISDMIHQIMQNDQIHQQYFIHIIKLRGSQLLFILIMKMIKREKIGTFIWLWATGVGIGIGAYYLISLYHFFGLILLLGFLFPHYFLYFFAYYKYKNIDYISQSGLQSITSKKGSILKKTAIILVVIIGVMSEFYVNPIIIKFFEKIIYIKNYKI